MAFLRFDSAKGGNSSRLDELQEFDNITEKTRKDLEEIINRMKSAVNATEDVSLPCLYITDNQEKLLCIISLRPHYDETSYRTALLEAASLIPNIGGNSVTFMYETQDDTLGILALLSPSMIVGMFCTEGGDVAPMHGEWEDLIDMETVEVLSSALSLPANARYVAHLQQSLQDRGHFIKFYTENTDNLTKTFFL